MDTSTQTVQAAAEYWYATVLPRYSDTSLTNLLTCVGYHPFASTTIGRSLLLVRDPRWSWRLSALIRRPAILYYDYALTAISEFEFFWRSATVSLGSILFVFVRYFSLLGSIPVIIEYFVDLSEHVSIFVSQAFPL